MILSEGNQTKKRVHTAYYSNVEGSCLTPLWGQDLRKVFPDSERDFTVPSFYLFYGWPACSKETLNSLYMENPRKLSFSKEHDNLIEYEIPAI